MAREPLSSSLLQLDRRTYIIAGSVLAVLIIGFIIWWAFFQPDPVVLQTNQPATNEPVAVVNASPTTNTTPTVIEPPSENILNMQQVAHFFAERYGSYTTDAEFANIENLKPYMTDSMQSVANAFIQSQSASNDGKYVEVVTKVIKTDVESSSESAATIRLTTQRTQSGENYAANDVYYEDLILDMVRQDEVWLVNDATWTETVIGGEPEPAEESGDPFFGGTAPNTNL